MGTDDSDDRGTERRYRRDPPSPQRLERGDAGDDDLPGAVNDLDRPDLDQCAGPVNGAPRRVIDNVGVAVNGPERDRAVEGPDRDVRG
ncbi:MAG TPA: hypothetical protein VIC81_06145 [Acidimicrobiales bacterium]